MFLDVQRVQGESMWGECARAGFMYACARVCERACARAYMLCMHALLHVRVL